MKYYPSFDLSQLFKNITTHGRPDLAFKPLFASHYSILFCHVLPQNVNRDALVFFFSFFTLKLYMTSKHVSHRHRKQIYDY